MILPSFNKFQRQRALVAQCCNLSHETLLSGWIRSIGSGLDLLLGIFHSISKQPSLFMTETSCQIESHQGGPFRLNLEMIWIFRHWVLKRKAKLISPWGSLSHNHPDVLWNILLVANASVENAVFVFGSMSLEEGVLDVFGLFCRYQRGSVTL